MRYGTIKRLYMSHFKSYLERLSHIQNSTKRVNFDMQDSVTLQKAFNSFHRYKSASTSSIPDIPAVVVGGVDVAHARHMLILQ